MYADICGSRRRQHGVSQYNLMRDSNLGAVLGPSTVQVPNKVTIGSRGDSSKLLSRPEKKRAVHILVRNTFSFRWTLGQRPYSRRLRQYDVAVSPTVWGSYRRICLPGYILECDAAPENRNDHPLRSTRCE